MHLLGHLLGLVACIGGPVAYLVLWRRARRTDVTVGTYWRDPDELGLPPAYVGYIWRTGTVTLHEIRATLLDLIDRGVITSHETRPEGHRNWAARQFVLQSDKTGDLLPHERVLLRLVFETIAGGAKTVAEHDIVAFEAHQPEEFADALLRFKQAVERWADGADVLVADRQDEERLDYALGYVIALASFAGALLAGFKWYLLGVLVGLAVLGHHFFNRAGRPGVLMDDPLRAVILHRSPKAALIYAKAEALRRYLHDFGSMQEKPTDSVVLWRRYLVFAEVFGMADEVDKELRLAAPNLAAASAFPFGSLSFWLADQRTAVDLAPL